MRQILAIMIALTACFSRTASANLNPCVNMNEATEVLSRTENEVKLTEADIARFWSKVDQNGPLPDQTNPHYMGLGRCWIWTASRTGDERYGAIKVQGKQFYTHRIAYLLKNGEFPSKGFACHKCDVKFCVNPDHLFNATNADNQRDNVLKGRVFRPKGMASRASKLTDDKVRQIRLLYSKGNVSQAALAKQFGVAQTVIGDAVRRKTWTHI